MFAEKGGGQRTLPSVPAEHAGQREGCQEEACEHCLHPTDTGLGEALTLWHMKYFPEAW